MAITRNLVVMLKDDVAKPKEKMFVYRDDVGVEMVIELKDFDYSIDTVGNRNNIQKAYALFRTPTKKTYQYTNIKISNGKLVFTFSQDIVNVMQEIGEYELQFQLYDKEDNRLTIPSYNFYVKEPLTIDGELVDTAVVDESVVVDLGEEKDYIFVITDGYIKTKWRTGDLITKERLNKVENALSVITDAVNSKVGISQLHNHENKEILDTISANKINEWDNKSNFNGDYNSLTNKPTIPTKVSDLQNDRGYLTEHQDISGKVDKVDGKSLISDDEIERLATLKNYDDTDIKNSLNSKANKTELHSHSNKNVLDGISSTKVTEWDNKSTFSGNYNDLTNKPTIPSLNGYATEQYVNEEIEKIDVTEQLTDYAKKSELHSHNNKTVLDGITSAKITEWNNKSTFDGNYNNLTNKPTIPTKVSELTNDEGYLTSIPSEYITESELNSKGYLTEHQDISGKVDKVDGHSLVSDTEISRLATLENYDDTEVCESINEINTSLEESVKFEVVGEGTTVPPISGGGSYILPIATKTTLGGVKIGNNLSIDNNGVLSAITSDKVDKINGYSLVSDAEISRLATLENYDDTDIKNTLNSKADKTELHSHNNKSVLDGITTSKISEWNNKSTFNGDYNDLTNKPTIPTKTSQLTNDNGFLTSIPSEYVTESELTSELDKVAVFVTPQMYGAVGDGKHDDTDAFQQAINENRYILIPSGDYIISSTITIPSDKKMQIEGKININCAVGFLIQGENIEICGRGTINLAPSECSFIKVLVNRSIGFVNIKDINVWGSWNYNNTNNHIGIEFVGDSTQGTCCYVNINCNLNCLTKGVWTHKATDLNVNSWLTQIDVNSTFQNCQQAVVFDWGGDMSRIRGVIQPKCTSSVTTNSIDLPLCVIPAYTYIDTAIWDMDSAINRYAIRVSGNYCTILSAISESYIDINTAYRTTLMLRMTTDNVVTKEYFEQNKPSLNVGFHIDDNGNLIMTENAPYTNLVPSGKDSNGNILNGVGYVDNYRISASNVVVAQSGTVLTGYIPYKDVSDKDDIKIKGVEFVEELYCGIMLYDTNFNILAGVRLIEGQDVALLNNTVSVLYTAGSSLSISDDGIATVHVNFNEDILVNNPVAYFRLFAKGKGSNLIVTRNEKIVDYNPSEINVGKVVPKSDYSSEEWTFTLADGSTVTKKVVLG